MLSFSLISVLVQIFEHGHLSRKHLPRTIFASVNYLSNALVKENLSNFPFTRPRKTCQEELASVCSRKWGFVKENLLVKMRL